MKILFVAAEVAPFVSVGGLSQVMYFLPQALRKVGHDVRIFTPKYGTMDETGPKKKPWELNTIFSQLAVPLDSDIDVTKSIFCNVKEYYSKKTGIHTYFLENREYYELRANVYGYRDDHIRFALLSKSCLEWLLQIKQNTEWWPDVIHCHDWHTGYFIDLARRHHRYTKALSNTPIVYTIHNFYLQGNYDFRYADKENYDTGKTLLAPLLSNVLQTQNPLKRGIIYSDAINTVSQTHAVEVMTPEYSEGLEDELHEARDKLTGILNGLDIKKFNPMTDKRIKRQFGVNSFVKARSENKRELQKLFGLTPDPNRPLLAFCGRLTKQKGLDLLIEVLPHLFLERPDIQLVILGSGDNRYRLELSVLQKTFPDQIGLHLRSDFDLPRKIFSGADMMLIPSLFEPGGIVALESLRYGCVPIVHRTGGLNDIITDFNPAIKKGNGFSFKNIDPWALFGTITEALTLYKSPRLWKKLVTNCLSSDFSWDHAAREYDSWYQRVSFEKKHPTDEILNVKQTSTFLSTKQSH